MVVTDWHPYAVVIDGVVSTTHSHRQNAEAIAAERGGVAEPMTTTPAVLRGLEVLVATHPLISTDCDRALILLPAGSMRCTPEIAEAIVSGVMS